MSAVPTPGLTNDAFLGGRLHLNQPAQGYRAATDPVLLAAAVPASPGQSVLELGCGAGAAILCLMARVEGLDAHGLELQPFYAGLARRNADENALRLTVHDGDLGEMPAGLRGRSFDHVLANPPFHRTDDSGAEDPGRDTAHREGGRDLADWIDAGLRRLKPKGWLSLIHRTARLGEMLAALEGRAGDIRVLPLAARQGRAAERVILLARKGTRGALSLLPPFVLHEGDSHIRDGVGFSPAAEAVLRFGNSLPLSL